MQVKTMECMKRESINLTRGQAEYAAILGFRCSVVISKLAAASSSSIYFNLHFHGMVEGHIYPYILFSFFSSFHLSFYFLLPIRNDNGIIRRRM